MTSLRNLGGSARALPKSPICRSSFAAHAIRHSSSQAAAADSDPFAALLDLSPDSRLSQPQPEKLPKYKTRHSVTRRDKELPSPKYQYHPPKYYRGPLHPIQSVPASDPISREFVPGPFNLARLRETYHSTLTSDILTLVYKHQPPGTEKREQPERLRPWDGSSPYHKNRPAKGPRGHPQLPLLEQDITIENMPKITSVSISAYAPEADKNKDLSVAVRVFVMALCGFIPEHCRIKESLAQFKIRAGAKAGSKATIYGNSAWEFCDKLFHLVLPRLKDFEGVRPTTADGSGNFLVELTADQVRLFPEIEQNYGMYPSKFIPGLTIWIKTSANSNRQGQLLLSGLGLPFQRA